MCYVLFLYKSQFKNSFVILNYVCFVTVYPVMVVDVPSSGKSLRSLLSNCSSTASVHLQAVDGDVITLPEKENKLHNCTGLCC